MPGGRIVLGIYPAAHLHEYIHIITNLSPSIGKCWMQGYKPISEFYDTGLGSSPDGNELSYIQACSFSAYIIENFSFEKYLGYYIGDEKDSRFEDVFDITYEDAKKDWHAYLYK